LTDLSGYAKKPTANGDTRSGLRLRSRIAVPGRAADADLDDAILTDAILTDVRWPEGVRVPVGWMVDGDSGRLKRAGGLSEVTVGFDLLSGG
jgi:hypothetical protein